MGWLSRAIDAGADHRNSLEEVADGLWLDRGETRAKSSQFWVQLVLASIIAAGGVLGDATPAVIGAMIIAPLATPMYGLALAAVAGDRRALRASFLLLVSGIVVNILIGVVMGAFTVQRMPLIENPQVLGRTAPMLLDLVLAVTVGIAGSFALVRRDVNNILAGVAIAISLVPVLAVVGITLGAGRFDLAVGAFVLFLVNMAAILVAGVLVFKAAGYQRQAANRDARAGRRANVLITLLVVLLLVPLSGASFRTLQYEVWQGRAEQATRAWTKDTDWSLIDVSVTGEEIVVEVLGPSPVPPLDDLRRLLRDGIPADVPVTVREENGNETRL